MWTANNLIATRYWTDRQNLRRNLATTFLPKFGDFNPIPQTIRFYLLTKLHTIRCQRFIVNSYGGFLRKLEVDVTSHKEMGLKIYKKTEKDLSNGNKNFTKTRSRFLRS